MSTVLPEAAELPAAPVLPLPDELLEQPAAARAAIATAANAGPNFRAFKLVSSFRYQPCPLAGPRNVSAHGNTSGKENCLW